MDTLVISQALVLDNACQSLAPSRLGRPGLTSCSQTRTVWNLRCIFSSKHSDDDGSPQLSAKPGIFLKTLLLACGASPFSTVNFSIILPLDSWNSIVSNVQHEKVQISFSQGDFSKQNFWVIAKQANHNIVSPNNDIHLSQRSCSYVHQPTAGQLIGLYFNFMMNKGSGGIMKSQVIYVTLPA